MGSDKGSAGRRKGQRQCVHTEAIGSWLRGGGRGGARTTPSVAAAAYSRCSASELFPLVMMMGTGLKPFCLSHSRMR